MAKKLLASILALCLVLSTMGAIAFAESAVDVVEVYDLAGLIDALADDKADTIVMMNDISGNAELSNAYGKTGINILNGDTLDGNGYTLTISGATGTWGSAINTTGGTIKNLTIDEGYRGIFINHNSDHSEAVILENVTIDGPTYTISCDQGTGKGLTATNCTFNGWTSFAATLGDAEFINCEFGEGAGYSYLRPYAKSKFDSCDFEKGYEMDSRDETDFVACTYDGDLITSENIGNLVTSNAGNAVVDDEAVVNCVAYIPSKGGFETLQAAFDAVEANQTVELISDVVLTDTVNVGSNALGKNVTFDGNGHTIKADLGEDKSVIKFGNNPQWCVGINVENLNVEADSAFMGLWFYGGTESTVTNVNVTGNYTYYGVYFFGTHGGTVTNSNINSLFTNGSSQYPLNLVDTHVDYLIVNNSSDATDVAPKVYIEGDSYIELLEVGGSNTSKVNSLDKVGTVITEEGPAVAKVNGVMYASFEGALAAANNGSVIDLMGNVHKLDSTNKKISGKNITIKNGTFDISNTVWGGNSIFDISNSSYVTMTDVNFIGNAYSSAYGVIYAYSGSTVELNRCNFNLNAENYNAGGVLKGNGAANSTFVVNSCNFELVNPVSIIKNTTLDMEKTTINAKIVEGGIVNNAFREIVGTITDSKIYATGFENGIKNDEVGGPLTVNGNSVIKLEKCDVGEYDASGNLVKKGYDLVMTGSTSVLTIEDDAKVYADTVNMDEGSVVAPDNAFVSLANTISVDFREVPTKEGEMLYDIYLVGANNETINRLNSADLTFKLDTADKMAYEVIKVDNITVSTDADYENRYMFNFNGKDNVVDTATEIKIAQIKVTGYGTFSLYVYENEEEVSTNVVNATKMADNIVDTFVTTGEVGKGILDITPDADATDVTITVPTRTLTVNVDFPNVVVKKNDMTVTISGGDLAEDINVALTAEETVARKLTLNTSYTVTVKGAGYRTARYTVTMTGDKTLNFWNNVKDGKVVVEEGEDGSATTKNFLAGDIVADNVINIYDLSAAVSYFTESVSVNADYVKYDLNRDDVIDSKDVAYILASWGE